MGNSDEIINGFQIHEEIVNYVKEKSGSVLPLLGGNGTKEAPFVIGYKEPNDYLLYERIIIDIIHFMMGVKYKLKKQVFIQKEKIDILYVSRVGYESIYEYYFDITDCYNKSSRDRYELKIITEHSKINIKDIYDNNGYHKVFGIHYLTHCKHDKEGYDINGYNIEGYDKNGYDKNGYTMEGNNKSGFDKSGYDKNGFNEEGYDKNGYNKSGFNQKGFYKDGELYNKEGFDKEGYDKNGHNKLGFNRNGLHKNGTIYDDYGFDRNGLYKNGTIYDDYGFDRNGYDELGYDVDGYDKDGYDKNGYNCEDIHRTTGTIYNTIGFDKNGIHKDTGGEYNLAGVDCNGSFEDGTNVNDSYVDHDNKVNCCCNYEDEIEDYIDKDLEHIYKKEKEYAYKLEDLFPKDSDNDYYDPEDDTENYN